MIGPQLSAVIPAYNAAGKLPRAIASIRSQPEPVAVIVVDDGSVDDTYAVASDLADIVVAHDENRGPSAARNTGVRAASTDLVGFLDADDEWSVNRVAPMIAGFAAGSRVGIVIGATRFHSAADPGPQGHAVLNGTEAIVPKFCSSIITAGSYGTVGPIDESLSNFEDYDWFLRAADAGVRFVSLDVCVTEYMRRQGTLSHNPASGAKDLLAVVQQSTVRKRQGAPGTDSPPQWGELPRNGSPR